MMFQSVLRTSWISLLLFSLGACLPVRKVPYGAGPGFTAGGDLGFGTGSSSTTSDTGFGTGSGYTSGGSFFDSSSSLDAGFAQMVADLMRLGPNRPYVQFPWNSEDVPLGMVEARPVYPSSHVVHTSSGYQRARDLRTDNKYTDDTFDNIPLPETPKDVPGSGSQWQRKTK